MQVSQVFLPPVKSAIGRHFFELQSLFLSLSSAFFFVGFATALSLRLRLRFAVMHFLHVLKLPSNSSGAFSPLQVEQSCVFVAASLKFPVHLRLVAPCATVTPSSGVEIWCQKRPKIIPE